MWIVQAEIMDQPFNIHSLTHPSRVISIKSKRLKKYRKAVIFENFPLALRKITGGMKMLTGLTLGDEFRVPFGKFIQSMGSYCIDWKYPIQNSFTYCIYTDSFLVRITFYRVLINRSADLLLLEVEQPTTINLVSFRLILGGEC